MQAPTKRCERREGTFFSVVDNNKMHEGIEE